MKKQIAVFCSLIILSQSVFANNSSDSDKALQAVDPQLAQEFKQQDANLVVQNAKALENTNRLTELVNYLNYDRSFVLQLDSMKWWLAPAVGLLAGYYGYVRPSNTPTGFGKHVDSALKVGPMSKTAKLSSAALSGLLFFAVTEWAIHRKQNSELARYKASSDEQLVSEFKQLLCATNTDAKQLGINSMASENVAALNCK